MNIEYTVNPTIVRGLDYYTRTVFEFVSGDIGAQSTVCGGGRYDRLMEQMGAPATASLGFAMGIERLLMVLNSQNKDFGEKPLCHIYIAPMGDAANRKASSLCSMLRANGIWAETDICGRGLKAQMRYANKIGALYTIVLGDSELEEGKARLKCMENGEETEIELSGIVEAMYDARLSEITESFSI
jgi:histidyl-tRNA synthetase